MRNSITCYNIPPEFRDEYIAKEYFSKFGKVCNVTVHPSDHCCTVVFEKEQAAQQALVHGGEFRDAQFRIRWSKPHRPYPGASGNDRDSDATPRAGPSGCFAPSVPHKELLAMPIRREASTATLIAGGSAEVTLKRKMFYARWELDRLASRPAFSAEKRYQLLQAKDHYKRLCLQRSPGIGKAKLVRGTCPDMCPEKERYFREWKGMVPWCEQQVNASNVIRIDHSRAIKQYSSTSKEAPLPHELRTEQTLWRTMHYLLVNVVDKYDTDESVNVAKWFGYVWNRMRAIRSDIDQQDLCSQTVINLVEQSARFLIHCAAKLVYEEPPQYDQSIITESLSECLLTLKRMYAVMEQRGERYSSEAEFRTYLLLLHLDDKEFSQELQQMPTTLVHTPEVQFALSACRALTQNNYVRFFELVRATNYMNACIMYRYFTKVRENALSVMRKAYCSRTTTSFELGQLSYMLGFEDEEDADGFFDHYGVSVDHWTGQVILKPTVSPYQPEYPYSSAPAIRMVMSKRLCSVGETICGVPLDRCEAQFQSTECVSSFDSNGFFRKKACAEILVTDAGPGSNRDTAKPALNPKYAKKPYSRIAHSKIFSEVLKTKISNDELHVRKSTEFRQRAWNSCHELQRSGEHSDATNKRSELYQRRGHKRVALEHEIETIELVDSDSDKSEPKTADGTGSNDTAPNDEYDSISDHEFWEIPEENDKNKQEKEKDVTKQESTFAGTGELLDETKPATKSTASTVLKLPVERLEKKQTDGGTLDDPLELPSGRRSFKEEARQQSKHDEGQQCSTMAEMELDGDKLQEEKLHATVEQPMDTVFEDPLVSTSSNVTLEIAMEQEEDEERSLFDVEMNEHEEKAHTAATLSRAGDAWIDEPANWSPGIVDWEIKQANNYNSVSMQEACETMFRDAVSNKDIELLQECDDCEMDRSIKVALEDIHTCATSNDTLEDGEQANKPELRHLMEEEGEELMQPGDRMLSVNEKSIDVTPKVNEEKGFTATNQVMPDDVCDQFEEEQMIHPQKCRSPETELLLDDGLTVQEPLDSSSISKNVEEIREQVEFQNEGVCFETEKADREVQQLHEFTESLPEDQFNASSCSFASQEVYENEEESNQQILQSGYAGDRDWDCSDDDAEVDSMNEWSSESSILYSPNTPTASLTDEKVKDDLQETIAANMDQVCESAYDGILDSTTGEVVHEIAEHEAAWLRLSVLYSEIILIQLEEEVLGELIDESARLELAELEDARRKQEHLAYKYGYRWMFKVRIAARYRLLHQSVSPSIDNASTGSSEETLCAAFGKRDLIDPFAVLDKAVQTDVDLKGPFYWKLAFSISSKETDETFGCFPSIVNCWLRHSAFKRDPDYEWLDHTYLYYAARALPIETAICMRLIQEGLVGYDTFMGRKKAIDRSNGLVLVMHNSEPIAQVRARLQYLLDNVTIPTPAIAVLHFCPSRCDPVKVAVELKLDTLNARWKVFPWRHQTDIDPLRAATIFLAGCYRDQLHIASDDPDRLEMCSLIAFLENNVGFTMWHWLQQACLTEAAVMKDGALGKLGRDGDKIIRRYNGMLARIRYMISRQEIPSFARIAEEFDSLRARRQGRPIGAVSEALFPPDWHSAERRQQLQQLLDGLKLHALPSRLLSAIDRAASEANEKGKVLDPTELRVELDYYLSEYAVLFAEKPLQHQILVKKLAQHVTSQLEGRTFALLTGDRADTTLPRRCFWVPLLACISEEVMRSSILAYRIPTEIFYRWSELRRLLRSAWGLQRYTSPALVADRSASITVQEPAIRGSLATPEKAGTYNPPRSSSTSNRKRRSTGTNQLT